MCGTFEAIDALEDKKLEVSGMARSDAGGQDR
jgi:hypothetical protein